MSKKVKRNIIIFTGVLVVIFVSLFLIVTLVTTGSIGDRALSDMKVVAKDRAQLVETYIQGCCDYLDGYSKTTEVREVLENPLDNDCLKAVRDTTSCVAEGRANLEGLYVAKWDTYVLAHNNPDSMNQTFRDKDGALELEDQIKKVGAAFCTGIVEAPVTKKMVIPVYAPVKNETGEMIGFAGAAFFTDGLEECLSSLKGRGIDNVGYSLINAKKNVYIFSEDPRQVGRECRDEVLLNGITKAHTDIDLGGFYSYAGGDGITSCYYMTNRDWVFVVNEEKSELYQTTSRVNPVVIICFIAAMLFIFTAFFICLFWSLPKHKEDSKQGEEANGK